MELRPRKVIDLKGSKALTLPPEWIYHHQLGRGDLLQVLTTEEEALLIRPVPKEGEDNA